MSTLRVRHLPLLVAVTVPSWACEEDLGLDDPGVTWVCADDSHCGEGWRCGSKNTCVPEGGDAGQGGGVAEGEGEGAAEGEGEGEGVGEGEGEGADRLPAPDGVDATDGTSADGVTVTWTRVAGAVAYEISIEGATWEPLGDVLRHVDAHAPRGRIGVGTTRASDGTRSDGVALSLVGLVLEPGAARAYAVRAVDDERRAGQPSGEVSGRRGLGDVSYRWERSLADDRDGPWEELATTAEPEHMDDDRAATADPHWYRCVASAEAADEVVASPARGLRAR